MSRNFDDIIETCTCFVVKTFAIIKKLNATKLQKFIEKEKKTDQILILNSKKLNKVKLLYLFFIIYIALIHSPCLLLC